MMVQNSEKTLVIALESLAYVYDELIIVDGGSTDSTCEIALNYGAKIVHSKWSGNHSQQRNLYLDLINTDWIFVLDSDEFIDIKCRDFLSYVKNSNQNLDSDNFWIPRKWITTFSKHYYLTSSPHYPDFQRRLFKYNQDIYYTEQIHERIHNLNYQGICLNELSIYHLDLLINTEEQRRTKVRRYSKINPRDGGRHFYLPDPKKTEITEWNFVEILSSVQVFLENLDKNKILTSQLDEIISPEIKNDNFYHIIKEIVKQDDIKTVLEIGSSSGEGSTEAFVTGLRENQNNPQLFCIEISQNRFTKLKKKYANYSFVKCYNISSVSLESFPSINEIIKFYSSTNTNLTHYPLEQVIGWLKQDIEYLKTSGLPQNGIKKIKEQNNIKYFDAVLIDGSEFTGTSEINEIYGAKYIFLDDINTFKNYQNHQRLTLDHNYELVIQNLSLRNGYSVFRRVDDFKIQAEQQINYNVNIPINFFTIVLNGEPFIRYHIEVFKQLSFKWHWHIVEGVAKLQHDTGWSLKLGGQISDTIHCNGRSNDTTTEYLDELVRQYPDNITVYRQPEGVFWDGKREMVNEPLFNINEECLLWQIDVDELWTVNQICTARQMFIDNPEKTAAFYWCWYFVGENLMISTRNCYSQNPRQEWLRTWRYKPGAVWVAHEPPTLEEPLSNGQWRNVAAINPFLHHETEKHGLVFQHFAYVTQNQLEFKEQYYGYKNAVSHWKNLQKQTRFPVLLRHYFSWVQDDTMVENAELCGIKAIAYKDYENQSWRFLQSAELQTPQLKKPQPLIIIDGVFFQLYQTGIARVWRSLLEEWANNEFAKYIIVLDRVSTAPKISGIKYLNVPRYDYNNIDTEREFLQQICDQEGAELFISSYYTTPINTPSVFMAYDMIPEVMDWDMNHPMWQDKQQAIKHASAYIAISKNTALDLAKCFHHISLESLTVAYCGVSSTFKQSTSEDVSFFKTKYGVTKPYFLLAGIGSGYKNSILFFQAFSQLVSSYGFDIVVTGSGGLLESQFRSCTFGSVVHMLQLSDKELAIAYSDAIALVYPSKYEGFGLPVLEAMACACPVITCPNASIPEVAGEAAIYINDDDVDGLANALCEVQKPSVRQSLIAAGLEQAKKFSWTKMAEIVSSALIDATLLCLNLRKTNLIIFPDWLQAEELVSVELAQVIKTLATHSDSSNITLLIDTNNITTEDAELLLSSVTMNLLMAEDLDITDELEISLVGNLADIQWKVLIPRLHGRIVLEHENQQALIQAKGDTLTSYELANFRQVGEQDFF
ncbi:glycosyl transferase family 1 [Westiellopsis prolifica IICB1]|nr:glycosyl transferase family 1 [Westiellopsis prolifica IICB1]